MPKKKKKNKALKLWKVDVCAKSREVFQHVILVLKYHHIWCHTFDYYRIHFYYSVEVLKKYTFDSCP